MCTVRLCVRFMDASFYRSLQSLKSLFWSLFSLVSIAVWIYFNRLQNTGATLFCIWNFLSAAFFWHPWIALKGLLIFITTGCRGVEFDYTFRTSFLVKYYNSLTTCPSPPPPPHPSCTGLCIMLCKHRTEAIFYFLNNISLLYLQAVFM